MLICDSHADTLYEMQRSKRDPSLPLCITYERLQSDKDKRVQALALFTGTAGLANDPGLLERELEVLARLKTEGFHQVTRLEDALEGVPNILLTIEGGDAFHGGLDTIDAFFDLGVRVAALIWNNPNRLANPALGAETSGLTPYGRQVVQRMRTLGMAVDISHLNPSGVEDLLEMGGVPPMASHSCARALCAHPRNLTDAQLRRLFGVGGYVGINFFTRFLADNEEADIDTVIDHMAHMCELGGEALVGMGSDFDGVSRYPTGLQHGGDVPALLSRMSQRGFPDALIRAIAGENLRDYLARIRP